MHTILIKVPNKKYKTVINALQKLSDDIEFYDSYLEENNKTPILNSLKGKLKGVNIDKKMIKEKRLKDKYDFIH